MQDKLFRKALVLTIIVLFVGANVTPSISGTISKMSDLEDDKKNLNENIPSTETSSSLTFHTFDKTGEKQHNVVLPTDAAKDIYDMQEELKYKIVYEPRSDETKTLKIEFVDMLDAYGLIPKGLSKNYVLSLLNPSWLNNRQKTPNIRPRVPFLSNLVSRIIRNIINLRQIFINRFEKTTPKIFDKNALTHSLFADTATATFCSIASGGQGVTLPLILTPRPRVAASWYSAFAVTMVGELLTGEGFIAEGGQTGTALGFIGMGLTYVFYDFIAYGFVGYALYTIVTAEYIDRFEPPNQEPVISDENPPSGTQDVPLSVSELSFRISDADGDLMDYTVTTEPNIGTGSGYNKKDGVYTVPISGLEYDKSYSWTVEVTDDKDTTMKQFNFFTEGRPPFDPFDEGWQYRKKVTIDHTLVTGDLSDFPILISTLDTDLRDKAQNDGDDILFMDGPGVATKLYHEIEYYNGASGELISWVNIPSLSNSVDAVFYMYYGNLNCASQEFPEMVWDSNFVVVYHMNDNDGGLTDSTINSYDAVEDASDPSDADDYKRTGKIGYAVKYDGQGDDGDSENHDVPDVMTNAQWEAGFTINLWYKPATTNEDYYDFLWLSQSTGIILSIRDNSGKKMVFRTHDGSTYRNVWSNVVVSPGNWYNYASRYDGTTKTQFTNGGDKQTGVEYAFKDGSGGNHLGACWSDTWGLDGSSIDEVRISKVARSDSWIKTSFNTMNNPSSFLTIGPEE